MHSFRIERRRQGVAGPYNFPFLEERGQIQTTWRGVKFFGVGLAAEFILLGGRGWFPPDSNWELIWENKY